MRKSSNFLQNRDFQSGFIMYLRVMSIFVVTLSFSACSTNEGLTDEQFWEITENCEGKQLCIYANVLTLAFSSLISEPSEDGFEVTGVKTDGRTVLMNATVPDELFDDWASSLPVKPEDGDLGEHFDGCRDEVFREFLKIGGILKIEVQNSNGQKIYEKVEGSC